ncbi:unnamed protein product [Rotaria magnacalcarata]|uniref:F-box domain-containing protein n=1 Tax=Rotaria magnacalcarata TaxID=392030 RepID=A0A819IVC0_9BILA|nr:unnamed protein product [Rotaria magnacalcarata]CAF2147584.1 unnamed protein product [Rotaria magnacalcarata]CAF3920370.1 unnamed protein product [Rotaria magnacalcarata]CAF3926577.1 unnamed protein product [Rotaria magnacalcarata]
MTDHQYKLVQHCIKTQQYYTIKIYSCYFLFHRNIIQRSHNRELRLELPRAIIKKLFGSNPVTVIDVTSTCHVDPSLYDIIIFADKSVIYTRRKSLSEKDYIEQSVHTVKKRKVLPYYVHADLELLRCCGMSQNEIDLFIKKLDDNTEKIDLFNSNKYDQILQKIIDFSDISTRLNCRLVSRKCKAFVDLSSSWHYLRLSKLNQYVNRALSYFQKINIRKLDLSQSVFEAFKCEITNHILLFSLRSLCISTDHSLEVFTLLFRIAPFLQYVNLIQKVDSSSNVKTDQLYDRIKCIICLCQNNLKCLRRLHIQLLSASDQIFLESSSVTSIPISYEIIKC